MLLSLSLMLLLTPSVWRCSVLNSSRGDTLLSSCSRLPVSRPLSKLLVSRPLSTLPTLLLLSLCSSTTRPVGLLGLEEDVDEVTDLGMEEVVVVEVDGVEGADVSLLLLLVRCLMVTVMAMLAMKTPVRCQL